MVNEKLDSIVADAASTSDDDIIRQLSENLQDITSEDVDDMCDEMDGIKRKEKINEVNWKSADPTRNLRKIAKEVDESIKKLPLEKVDAMVNNLDLKKGCVILLRLVGWAAHKNEIINDKLKEAIRTWVDGNEIIQERILGFINIVMSEPPSSWEHLLWPTYNKLLKPLFDLVWLQENDVARKYLAEYIAKSGLFPYTGANLHVLNDESLEFRDEKDDLILYTSFSRSAWLPIIAPKKDGRWSIKYDENLTKFLDLFHVSYDYTMEDGDVQITLKINSGNDIPYSQFEIINVEETDLRDITQGKMKELQSSDLVLMYTNTSTYEVMNMELECLVKNKYGGKVYCIVFPEGFDGSSLCKQSKDILSKVVDTCPCLTDKSVAQMIGKKTTLIDSIASKRNVKNYGLSLAKSMFGKK